MAHLIKPQNSLNTDLKKTEIKNKIMLVVNKFENIINYKLDPEFINLVANLIEHHVKKKYNIDKKDLLIDIFNKIFPSITDEENAIILKNLQYIFDNRKINKVSISQYITNFLKDKIISTLS